jgi:hypothetical protein
MSRLKRRGLCNYARGSCWLGARGAFIMELPERATDSETITTKREAGNEGRRTLNQCLQRGSMNYRTLGRTGIEDGDVALDDERQTGL